MKRKIAIVLLTCVLLLTILCSFVGCNRKLVTVNIYAISYPNSEKTYQLFSNTQWSGMPVVFKKNLSQYIPKHYLVADDFKGFGYYLDIECTKKYNLSTKIEEDTDLYMLFCESGSKFVVFCFEGEDYYFFVEDINAELTVDSFVVSAYGKELDREKIQFYIDEKMTRRIDITGQTFDTLGVSMHEEESYYYAKTLYVKLAE